MWISQQLILDEMSVYLHEDHIDIEVWDGPNKSMSGKESVSIMLMPNSREEANKMSVVLRLASKRMEDIGKEFSE